MHGAIGNAEKLKIGVWDLPTRLFHWLLVLLIVCAWVSYEFNEMFGDTTLVWHRYNGYAILVLLLWRVIWGVVGSPASRFANFLVWPWTALRYGLDLARGRERHYLGHNPLGSYMIVALMLLVATQGILGLFTTEHNDLTWGPLALMIGEEMSKLLSKYHVWLFENVLLIFIAAHIAANVLYRLVKKDPLIEAMITGTKPAGDYEDQRVAFSTAAAAPAASELASATAPARHVLLRALACLALAAAIFAGTIVGLGGKLFYS